MLKNVIIVILAALTVFGFVKNADNTESVAENTTYHYIYAEDVVKYIEYFDAETDRLITLKTTNEEKYFVSIKENGLTETVEVSETLYLALYDTIADNILDYIKIVDGEVRIARTKQ